MRRLHQTAFMAIVAALFTVSTTHAQAVAITSGTIPDAAPVGNIEPATPSTVVPTFDYSLMNWRAGLLSPYVQSNITTSTTAVNTATATPITNTPATSNPYAPSALTPLNQTSNTTSTVTTSPQVNTPATQAMTSRFTFAPRFVSFTTVTNENSTTGTLNPTLNNNNTTTQYNLNQNTGGSAGLLVSVPEPSTVAMCLGLFVLIGYGYMRRQKKQDNTVSTEVDAMRLGETNESMSV